MKLSSINNPVLRDFYQRNFFPLRVFKIKSQHTRHPDTGEFIDYRIELWGDKTFTCECLAGQYGRKKKLCWHANKIKEKLKKKYGSVENAIEHYEKSIQGAEYCNNNY